MLGNFSCFCCRVLIFSILGVTKFFLEDWSIRVSNSLAHDQDQHSVGPNLDPNFCESYSQTTLVVSELTLE